MRKTWKNLVVPVLLSCSWLLSGCYDQAPEEEVLQDQSQTRSTQCFKGRPVVDILARGAKVHGANGIRFDAADKLYIASVGNDEITVMDRNTGAILGRYGLDVGVTSPDDLAFGPDGSLYWTSFLTGEVGRLAPDGTRTAQMVGPGVNGIAFSPTGRLFASLDMMGDGLYELDPNLVNPPRLVAEGLGFLNAMEWGPDGALYGPLMIPGLIVRIDPDTGAVVPIAGGFAVPVAARFDQ